ncbi:LacI family DNA-binding transcriptional regulator [Allorhizobium undicola]|uniref:LacI family DNA-binding transcriptional regulator n=1 Tax=Allorhizobium undicola TaxID=78527 RepID=UPI003D3489AD
MRRPTIADLARAAGVSVATVDRVLSGRLPVREETSRKVYEAAEKIGYHGTNLIRQRLFSDLPEYRLGVILRKERHSFYQSFASEIEEAANTARKCRLRLHVQFAQTAEPAEMADLLMAMQGKVQAVAATGPDHHDVTSAVTELKSRGIPTFSLLSDFAQGVREAYIGANNLKAGRTAAWLISHLARRPGKVILFVGGHRFHGHALRETGFRSYMREYAPDFEVLDALVNLETRRLTYEALLSALSRHENLVGVYCVGGGMEGAIEALREAGEGRGIVTLVNELTPDSRQALLDRTISCVLQTPLRELCADLVSMMVNTIEQGMSDTPGQRFLPPQIWVPESL